MFTHQTKDANNNKSLIVVAFDSNDHQSTNSHPIAMEQQLQLLVLRHPQVSLHFFQYPLTRPVHPGEPRSAEERKKRLFPDNDDDDDIYKREEKAFTEYTQSYERFITFLQKASLFLPLISPQFLFKFWEDCKKDQRLDQALTRQNLTIKPVPIRPVIGNANTKPLCAYPAGYELEAACASIATEIEHVLYKQRQSIPQPKYTQIIVDTKKPLLSIR